MARSARRRLLGLLGGLTLAAAAAGCSDGSGPRIDAALAREAAASESPDRPTTSASPSSTASTSTSSSTTVPAPTTGPPPRPEPPPTTAPAPAPPPAAAEAPPPAASPPPLPSPPVPVPPFQPSIEPIDDALRARMTHSWRPGCPVGLEQLRHVVVDHWGYDGQPRRGELVAHADVADDLVAVFGRLWAARFPIERMELVDVYEGDDLRSMQANNTSAFNCREIDGEPGRWSNHAYGLAVDINPLVNPWVRGTKVDPPEGAAYLDRSQDVAGLIRDGDVAVQAFTERGWRWGGHWSSSKDYQHFDKVS